MGRRRCCGGPVTIQPHAECNNSQPYFAKHTYETRLCDPRNFQRSISQAVTGPQHYDYRHTVKNDQNTADTVELADDVRAKIVAGEIRATINLSDLEAQGKVSVTYHGNAASHFRTATVTSNLANTSKTAVHNTCMFEKGKFKDDSAGRNGNFLNLFATGDIDRVTVKLTDKNGAVREITISRDGILKAGEATKSVSAEPSPTPEAAVSKEQSAIEPPARETGATSSHSENQRSGHVDPSPSPEPKKNPVTQPSSTSPASISPTPPGASGNKEVNADQTDKLFSSLKTELSLGTTNKELVKQLLDNSMDKLPQIADKWKNAAANSSGQGLYVQSLPETFCSALESRLGKDAYPYIAQAMRINKDVVTLAHQIEEQADKWFWTNDDDLYNLVPKDKEKLAALEQYWDARIAKRHEKSFRAMLEYELEGEQEKNVIAALNSIKNHKALDGYVNRTNGAPSSSQIVKIKPESASNFNITASNAARGLDYPTATFTSTNGQTTWHILRAINNGENRDPAILQIKKNEADKGNHAAWRAYHICWDEKEKRMVFNTRKKVPESNSIEIDKVKYSHVEIRSDGNVVLYTQEHQDNGLKYLYAITGNGTPTVSWTLLDVEKKTDGSVVRKTQK